MAMFWGVRHAITQRQRQRQRQIHLRPEVESHYRPYMCYIFGKPWVQGTLWQCSEVSDMQIHKDKDKYSWAPIHFASCAFNVHGGNP